MVVPALKNPKEVGGFDLINQCWLIIFNETKRNRAKPNETKTILQLNLLRSIEILNSLFLMVRTDVNN